MAEQNININVDSLSLLSPVIAACLTNAFYTALLLKRQSGVGITPDVEAVVWEEVVRRWSKMTPILNDAALKLSLLKPSPSQPGER